MKKKSSNPAKAQGAVKHELLIEIGTEEMPANYLSYADDPENDLFRRKFREIFTLLNKSGALTLGDGDIACWLTPRRIVLHAKPITFNPAPVKEAVYGPAKAVAFDADGRPSAVLKGFVKSKGVRLEDLQEFEKGGKTCVGYWKSESPKPLKDILPDLLKAYLKALPFPKTMKWDNSDLRFPRPVRNILIILDDKPVKFPVGNLLTGNTTLFFLNGKRVPVRAAGTKKYFRALRQKGVIFDARQRRDAIEKEVRRLTEKIGGSYQRDAALLEEVTYLCERPVAVHGKFDEQYSNLPKEVLTASLSRKQRFFSVLSSAGKHLPYFIGVLDGGVKNKEDVAGTMAAILKAKLQDSHFFFEEDAKIYRRQGAASGVEKLQLDLKHLVYIKDMGTVFDKVNRMREIALSLGKEWGLSPAEVQDLERAARYSKTDLLTQMVGEFPELQGAMGGIYMEFSGKNESVCEAIGEHYLPASSEGPLPKTRVGAALALLDKADLVVSCFVAGKVPTSSQDPYALKRAMNGIFRIAVQHRFGLDWQRLSGAVLDQINKEKIMKKIEPAAGQALAAFYRERAVYFFSKTGGFKEELVQAVLSSDSGSFLGAYEKLEALSKLEGEESFKKTLKVVQRASNILKSLDGKEAVGSVKPAIFKEDLERQLFDRYETKKATIDKAIASKEYALATSLYADAFFDILHVFFEKVLVNVPEPEVRRNRLALLAAVRSLYSDGVADLSKVKAAAEE